MEDKLYLDNIEEYVYDQDKIVTYKWLAMTLSVPFSEATRMLSEFVEQHSAPPPSKEPGSVAIKVLIHVTYLVTGTSRSTDDDIEKIIVQIADQDELEGIKAGLDKVISVIVYSVQKGQLKDRSSLHTAEHDILQENLHNFSKLCAVRCADPIEQQDEAKVDAKISSLPMKSEEGKELDCHVKRDVEVEKPATQPVKSAPQPAKGLSMRSKKGRGPVNPKGIDTMFAAKQLKNVAKKSGSLQSDKPALKQEDQTKLTVKEDRDNHSKKIKAAVVTMSNTATVTTTTTKFDNEVFTTGDDDQVDCDHLDHHDDDQKHHDHHHREDQDHGDNGVTKEIKKEIKERQRSVESAPVTSQAKEQKKGKATKRRRVCQELSSEESDEDNSAATKKIAKSQLTSDPTGGRKKRKTVKRLLDKMYIDDDGSMVTEKVWQDVSTDDDEEMTVAATSKPKTNSSVKTKSKQSSISSFFHRK